jgi:hypothetical protein
MVISLISFDGFNFDFMAGFILCLQEDCNSFYCALYCCTSMTNLVWFIDSLHQLMKSEFLKIYWAIGTVQKARNTKCKIPALKLTVVQCMEDKG